MNKDALAKLRLGINLVYYGLYVVIVSILLSFLFAMVNASLLVAVPLGIAIGLLMGLAGRICCLGAPEEVGAASLITFCVAIDVGALAIRIAQEVTVVPAFLISGFSVFAVGGPVLFVIFLKRVAAYLNDSKAESRAGTLLAIGAATVAVAVVAAFVAEAILLVALLAIIAFFLYARLLLDLKASLQAA